MISIHLVVLNDQSINKYVSLLRKTTGRSISEILDAIKSGSSVIECNYYEENELAFLLKIAEQLRSIGAKIKIFEEDKEITIEMVKNLIESYKGIAEQRERLDELLLEKGDEG